MRRRPTLLLSLEEREEISRGLSEGRSLRAIAERLGHAPSTVSLTLMLGSSLVPNPKRTYKLFRLGRLARAQ